MDTAYRTINGVRIVATHAGGPYIDLHWHSADSPTFEVINVWDYRAGKLKDGLNISRELTEWIRETGASEIRNYYRRTA